MMIDFSLSNTTVELIWLKWWNFYQPWFFFTRRIIVMHWSWCGREERANVILSSSRFNWNNCKEQLDALLSARLMILQPHKAANYYQPTNNVCIMIFSFWLFVFLILLVFSFFHISSSSSLCYNVMCTTAMQRVCMTTNIIFTTTSSQSRSRLSQVSNH